MFQIILEKIRGWVGVEPGQLSEEEKQAFYERAREEVKADFYADLDIPALFAEQTEEGIMKYAGAAALIVNVITLIFLVAKL